MSIGLLLLLRNGDGDLVEDGKADHHAKGVRLRKKRRHISIRKKQYCGSGMFIPDHTTTF
jgi:hypothetical protein